MSRRPGLTRTEQLRQAKTARELERMQERAARLPPPEPLKVRKRYIRPEPKKLDFAKPGMTKAMLARIKQAEKFKQEYERKREVQVPKRTPAPIGGDPRFGRERIPPRRPPRAPPAVTPRPVTPVAGPSVPRVPTPPRRPVTPKKPIPKKTTDLAKMMNADVIQAEPVGDGVINNIVIPPGAVNEERTTIISVAQPPVEETQISQAASRSIQVISETLNEQDAAESAAVQSKLADLQQARRDFVIAAANVGASAFTLEDITPPELFDITPPPSIAAPEIVPPRRYMRVPELHEEFLQPEYGIDHPDIIAAREHMRKVKAEIQAREAAKRIEEEFERLERLQAAAEQPEEVPVDVPVPLEEDIAWEEREGIRIKAHIPPVPKLPEPYQYEPFDPEQLERFFDIQTYPPCEPCGPPPGREHLPPDLWELEDPWYKPPPEDEPDLMEFSDLIKF